MTEDETIERGPRVGVPGGARALRPQTDAGTPLSPAEQAKLDSVLGDLKGIKERTGPKDVVLVVEDDPQHRLFLHYALEHLGMRMAETGDGAEAFRLMAQHSVRLLVLDLRLPGLDGFEVIRGVRQYLKLTALPILVISGLTDVKSEVTALNLGADAFLRKPFKAEQIEAALRALLRRVA
ncbi:MAG: response regulator [Elusimicrobiota bacterium]